MSSPISQAVGEQWSRYRALKLLRWRSKFSCHMGETEGWLEDGRSPRKGEVIWHGSNVVTEGSY